MSALSETYCVVCDRPLDEALGQIGHFCSLVETSEPKINPRRIALGAPQRETGPDGKPVATIRGSFGSFSLTLVFREQEEQKRASTLVELTIRSNMGCLVGMSGLVVLLLAVGVLFGDLEFSKALGGGVMILLATLLPPFLIGQLVMPSAGEKLERLLCNALLDQHGSR